MPRIEILAEVMWWLAIGILAVGLLVHFGGRPTPMDKYIPPKPPS